MKELSGKQKRIFEYIRDFIDDHDYPPSIRQIQEACAISSTSVVDYNLRILEKTGHIRRDREVSRAIEVTHDRLDAVGAQRLRHDLTEAATV